MLQVSVDFRDEVDELHGFLQTLKAEDWERQTARDEKLSFTPSMLLTFRAYDDLVEEPDWVFYVFWHPDGDEFRTTPQFNSVIRETGIYEYWKARGFPPQCKPVGDDDFECGRP